MESSETNAAYLSWGRYPQVQQEVIPLSWRDDRIFPLGERLAGKSVLPQGLARSYGDACLNDQNVILSTRHLDRIVSFDKASGRLHCESGMSLQQILEVAVPAGWFLPVTPGTRFVTVGGAIANDIHGKNHHRAGTFGRHVLSLTLLRSNGLVARCTPVENGDLFRATIAGLGLTGLILSAEIQLHKISSPFIHVEEIQFRSLDEFRQISKESEERFDYTVAWIDCVSKGSNFSRGIFIRGNHAEAETLPPSFARECKKAQRFKALAGVPMDAPDFLLSPTTVRWFNSVYFHKQTEVSRTRITPYGPFFYPLDSVLNWNRVYGKRGFFQFQCVVPSSDDGRGLKQVFQAVVDSGEASFLAVIKEFGSLPSPGMLSFPRPGTTLCLDFGHRGDRTFKLLSKLENMVRDLGGAMYPAKDATMSAQSFAEFYPRASEFSHFIDPKFSSSFWRRVHAA